MPSETPSAIDQAGKKFKGPFYTRGHTRHGLSRAMEPKNRICRIGSQPLARGSGAGELIIRTLILL